MQYLTARQEVIRTLYSHRKRNRAEGATEVTKADVGGAPKETAFFDLSELGTSKIRGEAKFERLPKGETVEIEVEPNGEVPITLVKHQCKLVARNDLLLFDDRGKATKIPSVRSIIDRDVECDIPMQPEYRDVSRKHLIIDRFSDRSLCLTDVSSLGTFIPPNCLRRTSN